MNEPLLIYASEVQKNDYGLDTQLTGHKLFGCVRKVNKTPCCLERRAKRNFCFSLFILIFTLPIGLKVLCSYELAL